jgi:hypothetical protein
VWSDKCEASFQELKTRLTTTPVLTLPDASKTSWCTVTCRDRDSAAC